MYLIKEQRWSTVECGEEDGPSPRMGHLMLYHTPAPQTSGQAEGDSKERKQHSSLYVHGGMAEATFFDELYRLDIERVRTEHSSMIEIDPYLLGSI